MAILIPAIRASMGSVQYFAAVVTLGEAARLVQYVEDVDGWTSETPPELKLQRRLNLQRVEREMVPYLVEASDHFYSALTVEIRPAPYAGASGDIAFEAKDHFPGGIEFGVLTLDGTEALYALDGQHRLKSIELAIRQQPELAREHVTLILVPFQSVPRSQTLFSDLNRYAKGPSKSISLLFTHRERLARIAKAVAQTVPLLRDRVNMESTSLSVNARHFVTLSTLYEMTKALVGDLADDGDADEAEIVADLTALWQALTEAIPEWQLVATGQEHPAYLRARYLHMHGLAQQAIARAIAVARLQRPDAWLAPVTALGQLDWRLANPEWAGIAIHGGRVNNTSTSIRLLTEALQNRLGLSLNPDVHPTTVEIGRARRGSVTDSQGSTSKGVVVVKG